MAIQFVPFVSEHEAAVRAFNGRMKAGQASTPFLLQDVASHEPGYAGARHFLAVEGEDVRGGYFEVPYEVYAGGRRGVAVNCQSPLSEGLIDSKYMMLPAQMFKFILKQNPFVFVVGMGGLQNPLPRLLKAAGWAVDAIPFFFRVCRAGRFLRHMPMLQTPAWKRLAAQAGALSGLSGLAFRAVHRSQNLPGGKWNLEPGEWGPWCDAIWNEYLPEINFGAWRDERALRTLYPPGRAIAPLVLWRDGRIEGWSAVLLTPMKAHKNFGDLTVGTILDAVARPAARSALIELTTRHLAKCGADLVVTNQSHQSWIAATRAAGFRPGPSNYVLAASPKLAAAAGGRIHITRGDGDGRINL